MIRITVLAFLGIAFLGIAFASGSLWSLDNAKNSDKAEAPRATSARARITKLIRDHDTAHTEYLKKYRAAKDDETRSELLKNRPRAEGLAEELFQLVKEVNDPAGAFDALQFIAIKCRTGDSQKKAVEILARDHVKNPKVGDLIPTFAYIQNFTADKFLEDVREKHPNRDVRGNACFYLGFRLKSRAATIVRLTTERKEQLESWRQFYGEEYVDAMLDMKPDDLLEKAAAYFEEVTEKYADVAGRRRPLGVSAARQLFEMRHLTIGKVAPEIEGEDIDGKRFKLSEYRGQVVVLDFWGHW